MPSFIKDMPSACGKCTENRVIITIDAGDHALEAQMDTRLTNQHCITLTIRRYKRANSIQQLYNTSLDQLLNILKAFNVHLDEDIESITAIEDNKTYWLVCDHCFEWELQE